MRYIDLQVIKVTNNVYKLSRDDELEYHEIIVKFGSAEITAYFTTDINVVDGDLIRVGKWSLTNCWQDFKKCALMLDYITKIDYIDFTVTETIPIKIRGILLKSKNSIKKVGISGKRVYSSAIRFDNGRNKMFSVLVVGFNDVAEALYKVEGNSRVVISGTLRFAKATSDYEIHLTKVRKEKQNYERCNN